MRALFRKTLFAALSLGAILAGPGRAQSPALSPIQMEARPAFEGMAVQGGVFPLVVTLANTGANTEGLLTIEPASYSPMERRYIHRIQLPSGALKRVVAYPSLRMEVNEIVVTFSGDFRGRRVVQRLPVTVETGRQIGLISDQAGALMALRDPEARRQGRLPRNARTNRTCDARPEDAPDRMAGYTSLTTLVIADGAERMLPAQWAAIHRWAMAGGTVILSGGPGAVYLHTPDAQALSPLLRAGGATVSALRLGRFGPTLHEAVGLMTGPLEPGAQSLLDDGGRVLIAQMPVGAGRVLFTAFSSVERPVRGWTHQRAVWDRLLAGANRGVGGPLWAMAMQTGADPATGRPAPVPTQANLDPFQVQLPPTRTIVWMFLAYFILVVPVSYWVLRKARHLEWAWVTGPLLSVAFAFGFGLFAAELYQAGLSRRTAGVVVATGGGKEAQFIGSTEFFFPHGGTYTLEIPGAEILETQLQDANEYVFRRTSDRKDALETVDDGAVSAPRFRVTNLAFRRVFHSEPVVWGGLSGEVRWDDSGRLTGKIHNGTRYDLSEVSLILLGTGRTVTVGALKPGQTVDLGGHMASSPWMPPAGGGPPMVGGPPMPGGPPLRPSSRPAPAPNGSPAAALAQRSPVLGLLLRDRSARGARPSGVVLFGETSGEPFGPRLGRDVGRSHSVDVLVSLPFVEGGS